ncbi:hypothetical protein AC578_1714 [Pseudocercospora eumusae]|uniref:Uncharacterized protein n=1 Tax=Pseudocercospora eumusae TaxID=321146 RepID=A0A139GW97_9PEZI|nr:hypothetical protein AC578_1714 [Pseudocercospora eumusae]
MAEQARKKFYDDKRFSNFTSKWFEACCTAYVPPKTSRRKALRSVIRPFKEAADRSETLHEDDPVAIERMFEFFYHGSYYGSINSAYPDVEEKDPNDSVQLHAYVYVFAEKALRFKDEVGTGMFCRLKAAAFAVYQQVELAESNRTLKTALLEGWAVARRLTTNRKHDMIQLFKDVPEFSEDLVWSPYTPLVCAKGEEHLHQTKVYCQEQKLFKVKFPVRLAFWPLG